MVTFVAKKSGGVKKKPMIILQEFIIFVLVSTSGVSDWQACDDSHWNKRTTFVFHKIVIYNPWTWKRSGDSLKISLTPKRSEFAGVQKLFLLCREIGDKIDRYISYRVFFLCEATKGAVVLYFNVFGLRSPRALWRKRSKYLHTHRQVALFAANRH